MESDIDFIPSHKLNSQKEDDTESDNIENGKVEKLNEDQLKALELILRGENVFITGGGGTGKSFLLNCIVNAMRKICATQKIPLQLAVTAMTGAAAANLNDNFTNKNCKACTIHSWMGVGVFSNSPIAEAKIVQKRPEVLERWKQTNTLIIDEISMMSPELFEKIDALAKILRESTRPFGAMQLILCGDFFQLPPIIKDSEVSMAYKKKSYCFETESWSDSIPDENVVVLRTIYRQNDEAFRKILGEIREGVVSDESIKILMSRLNTQTNNTDEEKQGLTSTFITPRKNTVLEQNEKILHSIQAEPRKFVWEISKHPKTIDSRITEPAINRLKKHIPVAEVITLKVGCPVMLLCNIRVDSGLVNGAQGVITGFTGGLPVVKFANGKKVVISRFAWWEDCSGRTKKFNANRDDKKENRPPSVCISQIPLTVAAALTIHKVQGLGIDNVRLNLSAEIFAPGQAYVALSRCTSLEGLCLTEFDPRTIQVDSKVVEFYRKRSALMHEDQFRKETKDGTLDIARNQQNRKKQASSSYFYPKKKNKKKEEEKTLVGGNKPLSEIYVSSKLQSPIYPTKQESSSTMNNNSSNKRKNPGVFQPFIPRKQSKLMHEFDRAERSELKSKICPL